MLRLWLERGLDRKKIKNQNTIDGLTWAVDKQLIPAIGARPGWLVERRALPARPARLFWQGQPAGRE
jgi:hypothetical protein